MALSAAQPLDDGMIEAADHPVLEGNAIDRIERKLGPDRIRDGAFGFEDLIGAAGSCWL